MWTRSASMTSPKAVKERLISIASFSCSPVACSEENPSVCWKHSLQGMPLKCLWMMHHEFFLKKIVRNNSQSEQNLSIFVPFLWTSQTSQKIPGSICQYLTLLSPTAVTAPRFSSSVLNRQGHTRQGRWIWWVFVLSEQS